MTFSGSAASSAGTAPRNNWPSASRELPLGDLLIDGRLVDRAEAMATEVPWPGDAGQSRLGELALSGPAGADVLAVLVGAGARRRLRFSSIDR